MAVIDISDFRKGRNSSDDPLLLNPGNCVATSTNVWAPNGALQKVPGFTVWHEYTATASGAHGLLFPDSTVVSASYNLYSVLNVTGGSGHSLLYGINGSGSSATRVGVYSAGTISISGASLISATGSGTLWNDNISAGGYLTYNSIDYRILSVEDDTHLTLSNAVPGAVATGSSYAIAQPIGTNARPIVLNGSMWIGSSTAYLLQFPGVTADTVRIAAAPKSNFYTVFKNYAFAFNTSTAQSRLYWSAIKDPTSWPINNFIDIDKDRGRGQGVVAYGNELVCFKTNGMYKVVGDVFDPSNPTYAVYPISTPPDFRFYATYSAVEHNGLLYFIAANGVYSYQAGTSYITRVTDAISADAPAPNINPAGTLSNGTLQTYGGVSYEGCLIFMPLHRGNATKSYCLLMDRAGAWWRFESPETYPAATRFHRWPAIFPESSPPALVMPHGNGRIQKWDLANAFKNVAVAGSYLATADASSEAIQAQWRSKEFNVEFGHFKQLVVYLAKQSAGNLTVGWSVDQATFVTAACDMTQGRGNMIRKTFDINQKGSTIQIKFEENSADTPFKVYAAKIYYDPILENRQA